MCGRLKVDDEQTIILDRFGAMLNSPFIDWDKAPARNDVRPGRDIPIIGRPAAGNLMTQPQLKLMHWGWWFFVKGKTKAKVKRSIINSNTATIMAGLDNPRKSYLNGLANSRVIIPASGFYEWPGKVKHQVNVKDGALFGIAGYQVLCQLETGGWVETVVLITRDAVGDFAETHDAEPVILRPEDEAGWVACQDSGPEYLSRIFGTPNPALIAKPV